MQNLAGARSTGDLPTCDRVRLLGFRNRGADQTTSLNSAIDRRPHCPLKTCQRAMWIMIEVQILGKTRAFGKHAHGRTALQHEARVGGTPIEERQQSQLKCIARLGQSGHWDYLRSAPSLYDAYSLNQASRAHTSMQN